MDTAAFDSNLTALGQEFDKTRKEADVAAADLARNIARDLRQFLDGLTERLATVDEAENTKQLSNAGRLKGFKAVVTERLANLDTRVQTALQESWPHQKGVQASEVELALRQRDTLPAILFDALRPIFSEFAEHFRAYGYALKPHWSDSRNGVVPNAEFFCDGATKGALATYAHLYGNMRVTKRLMAEAEEEKRRAVAADLYRNA